MLIKIKCKGSANKKLSALKVLQGELKELSNENRAKLKRRIEKFGFDAPFFVYKNYILDGTQRFKVLQEMIADGWELSGGVVPVVEIKAESIEDAKQRILGYVSQFGKLTSDGLEDFITDIPDVDFGLLDLPDFDIEAFLEEDHPGNEGLTDPDDVPEPPEKAITNVGDLWLLGKHRLLCGDSTKKEDVGRLMGQEKADMVFTDPPYGMEYKGEVFGKRGIKNDGEEWQAVLAMSVGNMLLVVENAVIAICFAPARLGLFFQATAKLKFERRLTIYKPNRMAHPWRGWIMTAEDINLFSIGKPEWNEIEHCHDVYTFDYSERPPKDIDHPTVKPVSICEDVIKKCSTSLVYDPFLGSGTTLIACEKTKRKCYGIEIDPIYCDVIVKRWEDFTGKEAALDE